MAAFDSKFTSERIILMSAPNGARRMPSDRHRVPTTPAELADCAVALLEQGVSVLHLHVRDAEGVHSLDVELYRTATAALRAAVGDELVLQITTESVGRYSTAEQLKVVRELRPEAVSLALREVFPEGSSEGEFAAFCDWMRRESIWPQYILYSAEDVRRFEQLRRRGVFADERPFCLFVVGAYDVRHGELGELSALVNTARNRLFPWAACCFGPNENAVVLAAAEQGGHVRLGFENNVVLSDGTPASDNAMLIAQFRETARHLHRLPATADEVRDQWQ